MIHRLTALLTLLLTTLSFAAEPSTRPTTGPRIEVRRDIVYGKTGGDELKLDLARRGDVKRKLPCVIFVHGGGWSQGDKANHEHGMLMAAQKGYVGASLNYRMAPAHLFPAAVEDVKCAVRYLRSHTDQYGIDADHIGAVGDSAGGHLVMMLAVTTTKDGLEGDGGWPDVSSGVTAVVSWYGPGDLAAADIPEISKPIVKTFLGLTAAENPALAAKASPVTYVHKDEAPILMLQGTVDPLVPFTQPVTMANRMTQVGAAGRVEIFVGAGHGFIDPDLKHAVDATFKFLDEHLKPASPAR